jgi:hypothetical protein
MVVCFCSYMPTLHNSSLSDLAPHDPCMFIRSSAPSHEIFCITSQQPKYTGMSTFTLITRTHSHTITMHQPPPSLRHSSSTHLICRRNPSRRPSEPIPYRSRRHLRSFCNKTGASPSTKLPASERATPCIPSRHSAGTRVSVGVTHSSTSGWLNSP